MSELNINVQSHKYVDVIKLSGRVDSSNASEFDDVLKEQLEKGRSKLVLELSQVTYMSSAALRAMVSARRGGGDVRIASPSERVTEVLQLAGLQSVFQVYDDTLSAVGDF